MSDEPKEKPRIVVDADWKAQVQAEKEAFAQMSKEDAQKKQPSERPPLPPATFPVLVTTLSTQALFAMGHFQDPARGQVQRDLEQAKHLIDLLQVVEEKTCGNLTPEEAGMLENVLHELRMAYVQTRGKT